MTDCDIWKDSCQSWGSLQEGDEHLTFTMSQPLFLCRRKTYRLTKLIFMKSARHQNIQRRHFWGHDWQEQEKEAQTFKPAPSCGKWKRGFSFFPLKAGVWFPVRLWLGKQRHAQGACFCMGMPDDRLHYEQTGAEQHAEVAFDWSSNRPFMKQYLV